MSVVIARIAVPTIDYSSLESRIYGRSTQCVWLGVAFFLPFFVIGFLQFFSAQLSISVACALAVQCFVLLIAYLSRDNAAALTSRPNGADLAPHDRRDLIQVLGVFTIAVFATCSIVLALGFPRGFEATAYHLPLGVHFFQTGALLPWDSAFMHTFPANMSILAGFLLQFLPERLVSLANIPFLLLAALAVYCLSRTLHASRTSSWLAAIGLTTIPIVAFGALEIQADLAGMAFLALAVVITFTAPSSSRAWPLAAGAAAGLAFGFKSLHLVGSSYVGLVAVSRVVEIAGPDKRSSKLTSTLRTGLLYTLGFALTAGYWLARNWIELGNPLYPIHFGSIFDVMGWTSAPDVDFLARAAMQHEWVNASWEWILYPWVEGHYIDENFKSSSGLGAFFAVSVPLAVAFTAYDLVMHRRQFSTDEPLYLFRTAALFLGAVMIMAIWWIMQDRQPRYCMGALVLVLPLVARFLDSIQGVCRIIVRNIFAISAALMLFVIASTMIIDAGSRFLINKHHSRAAFYEYPRAVDNLPPGSVILNMGPRPKNYPLLGERLENGVLSNYFIQQVTDREGNLIAEELARLGFTHIYSYGFLDVPRGSQLVLEVVDILETNPANNVTLPKPVVLYKVIYRIGSARHGRQSAAEPNAAEVVARFRDMMFSMAVKFLKMGVGYS